jgi:phosphatidate cytidylyltransferase
MLLHRILTALVLLALLVPALWAQDLRPLGALSLLMLAAGGWEWARLNGWRGMAAWNLGVTVFVMGLVAWQGGWIGGAPSGLWWGVSALWVLGGGWALRAGPEGWPKLSPLVRRWLGLLLLSVAWLALMSARLRGLNFLLSSLCIVWMADVAAYFGGRAFGRRKLAPSISPGKSWEGVWSGLAGVWLLGAVWMACEQTWFGDQGSIFSMLMSQGGWPVWLLGSAFLCGLGVAGDLIESLVKRAAGAKDSSQLLPGHGGVLDRLDALLPVLPAVMAVAAVCS